MIASHITVTTPVIDWLLNDWDSPLVWHVRACPAGHDVRCGRPREEPSGRCPFRHLGPAIGTTIYRSGSPLRSAWRLSVGMHSVALRWQSGKLRPEVLERDPAMCLPRGNDLGAIPSSLIGGEPFADRVDRPREIVAYRCRGSQPLHSIPAFGTRLPGLRPGRVRGRADRRHPRRLSPVRRGHGAADRADRPRPGQSCQASCRRAGALYRLACQGGAREYVCAGKLWAERRRLALRSARDVSGNRGRLHSGWRERKL